MPMKMTDILILAKDEPRTNRLAKALNNKDHRPILAHSTAIAKQLTRNRRPDIAIIETTLIKDLDGIKAANVLQQAHPFPVILIAGKVDQRLIDLCKRPYIHTLLVDPKIDELHMTLELALQWSHHHMRQTLLRRQLEKEIEGLKVQCYRDRTRDSVVGDFGDGYRYSDKDCATYYHDDRLHLTVNENALLRLLASNAGLTVTFDEIERYIWEKDEEVTENSVRTLIWRLRKVLPTDIIRGVQGKGYRIK